MSLYESFHFSEGGIGVSKIAFSFERLSYGRIFLTEFGETFFAGILALSFSWFKEKNTPEKNSHKLSQ